MNMMIRSVIVTMTDPLFVYLADPPPPRPSGHLALNRSPAGRGRYRRGFEKLYDDGDQLGGGDTADPLKSCMMTMMMVSNWDPDHWPDILSGLKSIIWCHGW